MAIAASVTRDERKFIVTVILTYVPIPVTFRLPAKSGTPSGMVCRKTEQVRRPRADLPSAPGRLRVFRPIGTTTGPREASLYRDWQAKGKARRRPHPG